MKYDPLNNCSTTAEIMFQ